MVNRKLKVREATILILDYEINRGPTLTSKSQDPSLSVLRDLHVIVYIFHLEGLGDSVLSISRKHCDLGNQQALSLFSPFLCLQDKAMVTIQAAQYAWDSE